MISGKQVVLLLLVLALFSFLIYTGPTITGHAIKTVEATEHQDTKPLLTTGTLPNDVASPKQETCMWKCSDPVYYQLTSSEGDTTCSLERNCKGTCDDARPAQRKDVSCKDIPPLSTCRQQTDCLGGYHAFTCEASDDIASTETSKVNVIKSCCSINTITVSNREGTPLNRVAPGESIHYAIDVSPGCIGKQYTLALAGVKTLGGRDADLRTAKGTVQETTITGETKILLTDLPTLKRDVLGNQKVQLFININPEGSSDPIIVTNWGPPDSTTVQVEFPNPSAFDRTQIVSWNFPVPESENLLSLSDGFIIYDDQGTPVPAQLSVKARWKGEVTDSTKAIKFVHIIMPVSVQASQTATYSVDYGVGAGINPQPAPQLSIAQNGNSYTVDTGVAQYTWDASSFNLFDTISVNNQPFITMGPNDGVTITDQSVTRLEQTAFANAQQLSVTDTSAFSANDQLVLTEKVRLRINAPAQQNYIVVNLGTTANPQDLLVLARGTSREETVQVVSTEGFDDPATWNGLDPNGNLLQFDSLRINLQSGLSNIHYAGDVIDLEPETVTVSSIIDQHTLALSINPQKKVSINSQVQKLNAQRTYRPGQVRIFTVEENGPLRAVIFVEGDMEDTTGHVPLRYQARLTFYAGEPFVHVKFVRWNFRPSGYLGGGTNKDIYLDSHTIDFPFPGQATQLEVDISKGFGDEQSLPITLQPGDTVRQWVFLDEYADREWWKKSSAPDPTRGNITDNLYGKVLRNSNTLYEAGGNVQSSTYHPDGIALLSDGTNALAIGVLDFWERFPRDLTITPTSLSLGVIKPDLDYGPPHDAPGIIYLNQPGGSRQHVEFILSPYTNGPTYATVANKLKSYLHEPLYPSMINHYLSSQALFTIPYTLQQDWNDPSSGITPPLSDTYNHFENWVHVMLDDSYVTKNGVSSLWNQEMTIGGPFGEWQFYGDPHYGSRAWNSGYTNHYDTILSLLVQYLRTGDRTYLDWARPSVDVRTFYRTHKVDDPLVHPLTLETEIYEKGTHHNYPYPDTSHFWLTGSYFGCIMYDHQWACDNIKDWAEKHLLGVSPLHGNCGSGHGMRRYGWTALAGIAAYDLIGKQAYLDTVESIYLNCANLDVSQANGPTGVIPIGGRVDVWKSSILMQAAAQLVQRQQNPRQEILDYLQRWADWAINYNTDPVTNPFGPPWFGGTGPNNNYQPYNLCDEYDYNTGCIGPNRANLKWLTWTLTQTYLALLPYNMAREEWADQAREFVESNVKWNNEPIYNTNVQPVVPYAYDRFDPNSYAPVGGRVSQYYDTYYKSQKNMYYTIPPSMYIESVVRQTCQQLNGNFCSAAQTCDGDLKVSRDSGGLPTCCVPAGSQQGCIQDTTAPVTSNFQPSFSLHVSTNQFLLEFDTNEEATCRYAETDIAFAQMPFTLSTNDNFHHTKLIDTYNSQTPLNYPNGATLDFFIACEDLPQPGNVAQNQLFQVTINPPDITPPALSNIAIQVGENQVTISWDTNELASSQLTVDDGTNSFTASSQTLAVQHSLTITGLTPSTTYSYLLQNTDFEGNTGQASGTFTTLDAQISVSISASGGSSQSRMAGLQDGTYSSYVVGAPSIGYTPSNNRNWRGMTWFDLTGLPQTIQNLNAKLKMKIHDGQTGGTQTIRIYPLTIDAGFKFPDGNGLYVTGGTSAQTGESNWDWAKRNQVSWVALGGDFDASREIVDTIATDQGTIIEVDVTPIVDDWLTNTIPNYGFLITSPTDVPPEVVFQTNRWGNYHPPTLEITGQSTSGQSPCSVPCGNQNAQSVCTGSMCTLSCNQGYGNCDGNVGTGCESQLTTIQNCVTCGNACSFANAQSTCTVNGCQMSICNVNFYNLNADPTDGCEYGCTIANGGLEICGNGVDENCDGMDLLCSQSAFQLQPFESVVVDEYNSVSVQTVVTFSQQVPITYTLQNAPSGMTISQTGLIQWIPNYTQAGQYTVTVVVDDAAEQQSQLFDVTVHDCIVQQALWNTSHAEEGEMVQMNVTTSHCMNAVLDIDVFEDDGTSYSITGLDPGTMTVLNAVTLKDIPAVWIPDEPDATGNMDPEYFFVAHVIGQSANNASSGIITVTFGDPDGDGVPNLRDCNDNNPAVGECMGCAICDDPAGVNGTCIAGQNTCTLQCPTAPLCGAGGCQPDQVPIYPSGPFQTCQLTGNTGTCSPQTCQAMNCQTIGQPCLDDGDGDGVVNHNDVCPATPAGTSVSIYGAPLPLNSILTSHLNTNLTQLNLTTISPLIIGDPLYGHVTWQGPINLVNYSASGCTQPVFDDNLNITQQSVSLNQASLFMLNVQATVTLYNITLTSPVILHNGQACSSCQILNYIGSNLTFTVPNFN